MSEPLGIGHALVGVGCDMHNAGVSLTDDLYCAGCVGHVQLTLINDLVGIV